MKKPVTDSYTLYIGTYTLRMSFVDGKGEGIYIYQMNSTTGKLDYVATVKDVINPSYLTLHPAGKYIYAVNEISGEYANSGSISSFAINPITKELKFLNRQPTHGLAPCFVSLDASNQYALVANYDSGSLCVLPIQPDGSLGNATQVIQLEGSGPNLDRQAGPHAHMIQPGPEGKWIFAVDLGSDKIKLYALDTAQGKLYPTDPAWISLRPGSGPRHLAFHPNGKYIYLINELASTITVFHYAATQGFLVEQQIVSTLPDHYSGQNLGAEIQVHPNGRFVYVSNRGDDTLVVFGVEPETGKLTFVNRVSSRGKSPRFFAIDPTGNFLLCANQDSDTIVSFKINQETGELDAQDEVTQVPTPVCLQILS